MTTGRLCPQSAIHDCSANARLWNLRKPPRLTQPKNLFQTQAVVEGLCLSYDSGHSRHCRISVRWAQSGSSLRYPPMSASAHSGCSAVPSRTSAPEPIADVSDAMSTFAAILSGCSRCFRAWGNSGVLSGNRHSMISYSYYLFPCFPVSQPNRLPDRERVSPTAFTG